MNVTTPDGRTLRVHLSGAEDGFPVLAHHGTPSAGILYAGWADDASDRGVRLIGYDRPGYGGSTRHQGRSVVDAVSDVRAIAAALGIDQLATWGISGGGPHSLACAALAPDLVVAAACIAGPVPYGAEGIDFLEGMGEANVKEFEAVLAGEAALRPLLERDAAEMTGGGPEGVKAVLATLLSPVDEAAATGAFGDFLYETMELGLRGGVDGWLDDNLAFVRDWGFDPAAIEVPLLLLQGAQDKFVPATHFHWLAAHIPAAEARLEPEHGHLTLSEGEIGTVHAWLLQDRSDDRRS
jgi:pimeloyl-ACP methyl ester carboxylesterase